jgi:hypothetical protein
MADFTNRSAADMAADHPGINMGTTGSMHEIHWPTEDEYWRESFSSRPYASADRDYTYYRPAYEFGTSAASRYSGRDWTEVEPELEREWPRHHTGGTAWSEIKAAARDAWDRVRGRPGDARR